MAHYAVLWEMDDISRPVGLAIDLGDHVYVEVPDYYGVPHRFDGDYTVMQPDSTHVAYRPGDASYLDQILVDLSSLYAIGDRGTAVIDTNADLVKLLTEKVFKPRDESRVGNYAVGRASDDCPTYVREHAIAGVPKGSGDDVVGSPSDELHLVAA